MTAVPITSFATENDMIMILISCQLPTTGRALAPPSRAHGYDGSRFRDPDYQPEPISALASRRTAHEASRETSP
jgi:hypothetical protein